MVAAHTISLRDALAIMRSGQPFSCEVCTLDGERNCYANAILSGSGETKAEVAVEAPFGGLGAAAPRNPLHGIHGTANLKLKNGDIRKIYPVLLEKFNGQNIVI